MPKKTFAQHPQKKQVSPMPRPHTNTVNSAIPSALAHRSPLQVDDDLDLDDICPVCESECTCRKKPSPPSTSSALTPTTSSSISSALSNAHPPSTAGKRPLKIKLTLPPNLKSRKPPETHSSSHSDARLGTAVQGAGPSSRNAAPAPRRRGRPPKVPATKQNARRKVAADDMEYKARGTTGTSAVVRKPYQPPVPVASTSSADLSDSTLSDFPTFVPAASESTHSSSSESSDSSIDSDLDGEPFVLYNEGERHSTKLLPSHVGHKKRERIGGNRWEIKPRKKSVGAGEEEEEESSTESDQSSDDSPEDGDDENEEDEDEADVEADVEGDGGEMLADGDVDLDDGDEEMHGRIGVSFPGSGWSDDEESSFDADVFFANLDSDSGGSSPETHFAALRPFAHAGEREPSGAFSADEEDALLLMDIDPSVQLRRGHGEFEIGVDLDSLAFGWDGQLLFSHAGDGPNDGLGLSFSLGAADEDEEMAYVSGSEATVSWEDSGTGTVILQESDGDTTEDELVDSDGLPNPRAMMLFKWPSTISAINPLSTLSPSSFSDPPPNATPSTRIALASISAQRRSPPPTPSPADILAGRLYMDDLEDIDMEKLDKQRCTPRRRRGSGVPIMGEFTVEDSYTTRKTAVVAAGCEVPSFYRRVVRVPEPEPVEGTTPIEDTSIAAVVPTADSSEANPREPSQQSYASDSTTEAIDLDDVLDSSFLDPEPSMQDCETDIPDSLSQSSPMKPGTSPHLHNLSRWDRVPMATFRRTRESATASGVDATASDSGLHALQYHNGIGSMMGGMSLFTPPRPLGLDKMSRASARKKKGRHSYNSSPTLPPSRDGVLGSPFVPTAGPSQQGYTSKTKKELKKEKAMMKRKMTTKTSQQHRPYQPYRAHHHHHPNHKSRATNAVQRTGFSSGASSSIPSLTI